MSARPLPVRRAAPAATLRSAAWRYGSAQALGKTALRLLRKRWYRVVQALRRAPPPRAPRCSRPSLQRRRQRLSISRAQPQRWPRLRSRRQITDSPVLPFRVQYPVTNPEASDIRGTTRSRKAARSESSSSMARSTTTACIAVPPHFRDLVERLYAWKRHRPQTSRVGKYLAEVFNRAECGALGSGHALGTSRHAWPTGPS